MSRKEGVLVTKVEPQSPADEAGIKVGDKLTALNGRMLKDIIEYQLVREDEKLDFSLIRSGRRIDIRLENPAGAPIGLALEKSIFDRQKVCENSCLFCFVDQLPPGCRSTLYIKDDDYRLSFLYGNFVTLTNLSRADLKRIVEQRLSPLFVSIHSTDPLVRRHLVNPPSADKALDNLKTILSAGIQVHAQIVACPGVNDGSELERTLSTLFREYDIASVGIVPVGLTSHRAGLADLKPFNKETASALIEQVLKWQEKALNAKGYRWVYAADEFYLMIRSPIPPAEMYDGFSQAENGIGIARLFMDEIADWIADNAGRSGSAGKTYLLTAAAAAEIFEGIKSSIIGATGANLKIIVAKNHWLGGRVNVAGLLAGADIIEAVRRMRSDGKVLVPSICLNPDGLFLDNLTVEDVKAATGVGVIVVPSSGWGFMEALVRESGNESYV